jgi:farnesyl-diphosphate farnesyltransferase
VPALLARVSRSFYLSIRLLPAAVRQPVAVGYLLARTSDTLADAPGLQTDERRALLDRFEAALHGEAAAAPLPTPAGASEGERDLLAAFPAVIAQSNDLASADRADVLTVLGHITRGQRLDVGRGGVESAEELDEYTYLVAGCVGEFWTRVAFRHIPGFAQLTESEMLDLGRRYGMALQLVNVLRDAGADLAQGRRYLPVGADVGLWRAKAKQGLEAGMRYSLAVRPRRVRVASALPALIGIRTLERMHGSQPMSANVKVPRAEVRALLARIALSLGSTRRLQREWDNRAP